jgi:hypothetical protein
VLQPQGELGGRRRAGCLQQSDGEPGERREEPKADKDPPDRVVHDTRRHHGAERPDHHDHEDGRDVLSLFDPSESG